MHILPTFLDHPKTMRLCRALQAPHAPLYLLRIWAFCQIEKTDRIGSGEDLEMIARWDGDTNALVQALLSTRWIEEQEGTYVAHAFLEHNAKLLNLQQSAAIKKRWEKKDAAERKDAKNTPVSYGPDTPNIRRIYGVSPNEWNEGNEGNEGHTPISPQASERKTIVSSETKPPEKKEKGPREQRLMLIDIAANTGFAINELFGRNAPQNLSSVMQARLHDHATRGLLPMPEATWQAIVEMHRAAQAPGAMEDFELRVKWLKSAEALAEHLPEAGDRAIAWCREHRPGLTAEKKETRPEPEGWREWLADAYPNGKPPLHFRDLPADIRAEFEGREA